MGLALRHDKIERASVVADRPPSTETTLRKRLWLAVAKKVISQQRTGSIKTGLNFLKRCDLLRIEDLIPFFPDFVVINDFDDEICPLLSPIYALSPPWNQRWMPQPLLLKALKWKMDIK